MLYPSRAARLLWLAQRGLFTGALARTFGTAVKCPGMGFAYVSDLDTLFSLQRHACPAFCNAPTALQWCRCFL
jgi:hypothetical protein